MTNKILLLVLILIAATACNLPKDGNKIVEMDKTPIVTVNGHTLYQSELRNVMPSNLSEEDSIKISGKYIRGWINEWLMYDKASENTSNSQTIDQLVEAYRRSLITNVYQERILKEHFSKSSSEANLSAFFNQHIEQFKLESPIIKGLYLKIPINSPQLSNFRHWYKQSTDIAIENIEKNTLLNVVNYEYFYDKWLPLSEVLNSIPQTITDNDLFLETNKSMEVSDSSHVYLLNIKEYKLTGDEAPYEYVKDKLPEAYNELNRIPFLDKIGNDLYNKAVADKKIIYYNK